MEGDRVRVGRRGHGLEPACPATLRIVEEGVVEQLADPRRRESTRTRSGGVGQSSGGVSPQEVARQFVLFAHDDCIGRELTQHNRVVQRAMSRSPRTQEDPRASRQDGGTVPSALAGFIGSTS